MKVRKTIALLGLSTLLGIGVVTAINNSDIEEVNAATDVAIYLDVSSKVEKYYDSSISFYWDESDAQVRCYYYGGGNTAKWPGTIMNKIKNGLYSVVIPSDTTSFIFTRVNPNDVEDVWARSVFQGGTDIAKPNSYSKNNLFVLTKYDCPNGTDAGSWSGLADVPSEEGYYLVGNDEFIEGIGHTGTAWKYASGRKMDTLSGEGDKARSYNFELKAGSKFKARSLVNKTETWYSGNISEGTVGLNVDDEGNFEVTSDGRYNIFINSKSEAWASNTHTDIAIAFAKSFNIAISGACSDSHKTISSLTTAWSNQVTASSSLDPEAIGVLEEAIHDDEDDDLATFAIKYDYVYGKYGYTNNWVDFANRSPSNTSDANRMMFGYININNYESIITISIISVLTISSIGMYYFFGRMKKKEN